MVDNTHLFVSQDDPLIADAAALEGLRTMRITPRELNKYMKRNNLDISDRYTRNRANASIRNEIVSNLRKKYSDPDDMDVEDG
ncbi:uncharacterized protein BDV17DRAFT_40125 [Aspergillus undulatus]|uniref:uncharacterized protein n=1 Tax=Aspergillus undulatus TaxID=1810928 RepID=UPI003CCDEC38